jgi:hypothetical protein
MACQDDKGCTLLRFRTYTYGDEPSPDHFALFGKMKAPVSRVIAYLAGRFFSVDLDQLLCHNVANRCLGYSYTISIPPSQTLLYAVRTVLISLFQSK